MAIMLLQLGEGSRVVDIRNYNYHGTTTPRPRPLITYLTQVCKQSLLSNATFYTEKWAFDSSDCSRIEPLLSDSAGLAHHASVTGKNYLFHITQKLQLMGDEYTRGIPQVSNDTRLEQMPSDVSVDRRERVVQQVNVSSLVY